MKPVLVKTEKVGNNKVTMFADVSKKEWNFGIHTTITNQLYWHYSESGARTVFDEWVRRFKQIQKYGKYE